MKANEKQKYINKISAEQLACLDNVDIKLIHRILAKTAAWGLTHSYKDKNFKIWLSGIEKLKKELDNTIQWIGISKFEQSDGWYTNESTHNT